MLVVPTPTQVRLYGYEGRREELDRHLTYIDKRVDYDIQRHKRNAVYARDQVRWEQELADLKAQRKKSLVFEDEEGLWTYSGLAPMLARVFDDQVEYKVKYPYPHTIPWEKEPKHKPRYYQEASRDKLLEARHGAVEIGTGLGKSYIISLLTRHLGMKTIIMAPSKNIAEQLYEELSTYFGKRRVGMFGDGKKQSNKQIVVGIAASLTKVAPGTPHWIALEKAQVFIADESHLCPAVSLAHVCFGLAKDAPYRFFFSATQMRNDGADILLQGITSDIVYSMTVREGVDQGFLAQPIFRMIQTTSNSSYGGNDPMKATRKHLYYNEQVNQLAADIANKSVALLQRPVLILVEEIEQFVHLLPYFRCEARFAHGGVTAENRGRLPSQYHDSDPKKLVTQFNANEYPILVGTSCISTGTDIQAAQTVIYLQGQKSEIKVRQAVGRSTRRVEGVKSDCFFVDFDVINNDYTHRHAEYRTAIYDDIYPGIDIVGCE